MADYRESIFFAGLRLTFGVRSVQFFDKGTWGARTLQAPTPAVGGQAWRGARESDGARFAAMSNRPLLRCVRTCPVGDGATKKYETAKRTQIATRAQQTGSDRDLAHAVDRV